MKNLVLGFFVLSMLVAPVAFAERGSGETMKVKSGSSKTNVDITCVGKAVSTREDAIISAWGKFDDAVTAVLTARKTALTNAWSLTDASARKSAVRSAWSTAKKDRKAATDTYKKERKAAWDDFKKAAKACGGDAGDDASDEKDSGSSVSL